MFEIFKKDIDINIKEVLKNNRSKIEELKSKSIELEIINKNFFSYSKKESKNLTQLEIAKKLKTTLPKYIYGQNHVIEEIVDYFKNNLIKTNIPKATFLFLGPPATGKTYMAEIMAKLLDGYKYKIFDMTQFITEDSGIGLYGSDYRYKNSSVGELTNFVLHNPKSIIVFDEIEKAHSAIQNDLLQFIIQEN